jgi:membrane protein YqaA with SNARE-associated domain
MTSPEEQARAPRQPRLIWLRPLLLGLLLAALNIAAYYLLPEELIAGLGSYGYLGAFLSAALANATVLVPVPYYPLLLRLAATLNPWGLALAAASGSVLGELVSFYIGRSGRGAVEQTRFYHWVHRQLSHPWRAPLALFALSAPPSPFFDVAGLIAGAVGVPLWIFVVATLLGRVVRMLLVVVIGQALG